MPKLENETFGSSGLSADQSATNSPAVGIERDSEEPLNVVVSGWQIYNNKGKVVEQYEPFFDKGFEYVLPQLSETSSIIPPQLGVKIKMYYDPLGRVVKTINPDNSQQWVIYGRPNALDTPLNFAPTPWVNYAYDANDLAPITNPGSNVNPTHWYTPKSSLVDALGRTIETTEHKAHYNAVDDIYEDVVMSYAYDVRGNLLEVKDPYQRKVFEHVYDLRQPQEDTSTGSASGGEKQPLTPLWTKHIDQGISVLLPDASGKPIESSDAKEARSLSAYDRLSRPTHGWTKNNTSDSLRLTSYAIYGEEATDPKDINLNGQLWQQYDESGKIEMIAFDFKGNLLSKKQLVISSATLKIALDSYTTYLVDWTGLPSILGTQEFETSSEFDALNRATKITLPEDVNTDRKEIIPTYNRAGALEKVAYDSTEYVKNIVYSAKGQRLLIAFGNDVMTRYAYDPRTFRLLRQRSEKYTYSLVSETHTYTPDSGTNRQDDGFNFDLVGNILKILLRVNDCGITGSVLGSNKLDREFTYDPLYRVTSGNGRESDTQNENDYLYSDAPAPGNPNADDVRAYTRQYNYDKLGNVQQVTQTGTNGFTRNFVYNTDVNTLQKIETGSSTLIQDFTYDAVGNQITAGTTRNYVWNAGNQLITYYNQAGMSDPTIFAQYDYSGMNRVSKMVRTGTAGSPIYERTIYIDGIFEYHILENGTTYEKNYVHVMDDQSRIAMVRIGTPFPDDISDAITYNLEDQIGSSSMRLNTTGGVIDKEEYYPFGDSSLRTFTKKRYRFTGKERDGESGLYYYGARYYSPWTCRFISVDQLAAKYPGISAYVYAFNNPIMFNDPTGMEAENVSDSPKSHKIDVSNTAINSENDELYNNAGRGSSGGEIDKQNPDANETEKPPKGPPRLNLGIFTLTFGKRKRNDATKFSKFSIDFSWNFTLSIDKEEKKVWRTKKFKFNNKTEVRELEPTPLSITYPTITVGGNTTEYGRLGGQTLNTFVSSPDIVKYAITSANIGTKMNDHAGDTIYQLNVDGKIITQQNGNRDTSLNPKSISAGTVINASIVGETTSDGRYDQCNGYKVTVKIDYQKIKTVMRLRKYKLGPN